MQAFRESCYRCNGWLPATDPCSPLVPGDVFVIKGGAVLPLLNIYDIRLLERLDVSDPRTLVGGGWALNRGLAPVLTETMMETDEQGESVRAVLRRLRFGAPGDFVFRAGEISARYVLNWPDIQRDLILKLTQLHYTFRDVCVVTAVAKAYNWMLAIAGGSGAVLTSRAVESDGGWFDDVLHESACRVLEDGMAYLAIERDVKRPAHFFQAQRLRLSDAVESRLLRQVLEQGQQYGDHMRSNWLQVDRTSLMRGSDLNLNTAMDTFTWRPVMPEDFADTGG